MCAPSEYLLIILFDAVNKGVGSLPIRQYLIYRNLLTLAQSFHPIQPKSQFNWHMNDVVVQMLTLYTKFKSIHL